jgi:hypothetical protein
MASSGTLFGLTGCPDNQQILTGAANSTTSFINGLLGSFVSRNVNGIFGV